MISKWLWTSIPWEKQSHTNQNSTLNLEFQDFKISNGNSFYGTYKELENTSYLLQIWNHFTFWK